MMKDFKCHPHLRFEKWWKVQLYFYIFSENFSMTWVKVDGRWTHVLSLSLYTNDCWYSANNVHYPTWCLSFLFSRNHTESWYVSGFLICAYLLYRPALRVWFRIGDDSNSWKQNVERSRVARRQALPRNSPSPVVLKSVFAELLERDPLGWIFIIDGELPWAAYGKRVLLWSLLFFSLTLCPLTLHFCSPQYFLCLIHIWYNN